MKTRLTRRFLLTSATASLAAPAIGQGVLDQPQRAERNISSFRNRDWRPYFSNLAGGAILVDIDSRAVHYWSEDQQTYKLYPSSVPLSEDLTRRGRTSVVRKVE
ncbi:MAG: L,D-transpeptidase, partial [Pseudomonadota bacterium]